MNNIRSVCPTVASMFGIAPFTDAAPMEEVTGLLPDGHADRVLMYNPDAIAWWLFQKYNDRFKPVLEMDPLVLQMRSVMPSVTPVCFASMYTGLMPADHGIQKYVKPVLTVPTLFDAMIKAGKKPAICSTGRDSISLIFLQREMDYFIFDTPDQVNQKVEELIGEDRHDLIVAYNGNYDSAMHGHGPEDDVSMNALAHNIEAYRRLTEAAAAGWKGKKWVTAFAPDHGCHEIDGGFGSHGLDMDEDMFVVHFWKSGR